MSVRQQGCRQQLLKKLVETSGKSVKDLAEEIGISHGLLKRLLSGNYEFVVKEEYRSAICSYFEISDDELFPFVAAN
ncbi:helix-turn-helix domain-containing protein [Bdellovibrio bacteriovorus]|uniref:helix-turn-helix domain-containing protein n=1 Tax=Bdellovibrio bacteriovorus TaxID=959 RepID=UPI0035A6F97A